MTSPHSPESPPDDASDSLPLDLPDDIPDVDDGDLDGRALLIRTLLSVGALIVFAGIGAVAFRDPLTRLGTWIIHELGLLGAFIGTFLCDSVSLPVPPDTFLVAAVTGVNADPVAVIAVMCVASLIGAQVAYWLGGRFERWAWLSRRLQPIRAKGATLFERWGLTTVTIAAWTPLPFCIICWCAGMFKMPRRRFFMATLHRIPRFIATYAVIALGWTAGGALAN